MVLAPAKGLFPIADCALIFGIMPFGQLGQLGVDPLLLFSPVGQGLLVALVVALGRSGTKVKNLPLVLLPPPSRPVASPLLPSQFTPSAAYFSIRRSTR